MTLVTPEAASRTCSITLAVLVVALRAMVLADLVTDFTLREMTAFLAATLRFTLAAVRFILDMALVRRLAPFFAGLRDLLLALPPDFFLDRFAAITFSFWKLNCGECAVVLENFETFDNRYENLARGFIYGRGCAVKWLERG